MPTDRWHGDVLAGTSEYDEPDHELVDAELSAYQPARAYQMPVDGYPHCAWSADEFEEFEAQYLDRLREVADRPDAEVCGDVLRALEFDSVVPMTVDAQVCDGVVTLTGTVTAECEREDAKYLAGLVPGVFGVIDELACWPVGGAGDEPTAEDDATRECVAAALRRTAIPDLAELTIDEPRPATVVLSGGLMSRSDRDLAIAWSVPNVSAVDDCIDVES
jgi:osmotically-inducible protein OsmY